MAGDWIKIEHALPNKPEVMAMAEELGISELEVVGHLVCFWTWVDQNLSEKCPAVSGTKRGLDRVAGRTGFAQAMINAGWLNVENGLIEIPNYEVHLSQTAKARSVEAKRKQKQRLKMSQDVPDKNGTYPGTEKRREEKSNTKKTPLPPSGEVQEKQPFVTVEDLTFPPSLDNPESREAFGEWLAYKRERRQGYKNPGFASKLLAEFGRDGPLVLRAAVDYSIGRNYQGLVRPESQHAKPSTEQRQLSELDKAIRRTEQEIRDAESSVPAGEGVPRLPAG